MKQKTIFDAAANSLADFLRIEESRRQAALNDPDRWKPCRCEDVTDDEWLAVKDWLMVRRLGGKVLILPALPPDTPLDFDPDDYPLA